ncbi:MAG: L-serine ammonia-lyase, iron-sulfur-dependent, subunit beta, partial [Lachnospiraceae bacterium]
MIKYDSIAALVREAGARGIRISELCLADPAAELGHTEEEVFRHMEESFDIMVESTVRGQDPDMRSTSGLTGGEGYKMMRYATERSGGLSGGFMTRAMSRAMAVSNCNAAMGRIVAAPTAGSCGILPGCLVSMYEEKRAEKRDIVLSLFTAGAFGMVVAEKASVAGAQGGCQAECGSAAGMAAAALVELMGGNPEQCAAAFGMAIANQLGLVCDPVAGLVEIPCIKRNVAGVMIAFS